MKVRSDAALARGPDEKSTRQAWTRRDLLVLLGLAALAALLRLSYLGHVPPGVRFDELVNVKMADHVYAGEWPLYFREAWGHEPLYHYFHAAGMALLGHNVYGVRITSALFGIAGVLAAYVTYRLLFGPTVALIGATMLCTSFWSLMYSRFGLRHISLTPWVCLAVYGFWRGLEEKRWHGAHWFALGGVSMGAAICTYFAGRVLPALFITLLLYLLAWHRSLLKGRWGGIVLFALVAMAIAAPMFLYLHRHPELEQRLGQVGQDMLKALRRGDLKPLWKAILSATAMFGIRGDPEWLYNISGRPVFDPLTAVLFYAGVAFALWRWRDPRHALILLWLAAGVAPTMLSWPPGSLGHSIAAQPIAFVFPALILETIAQSPRRAWRMAGQAFAIGAVTLFAFLSGYDYFVRWPSHAEVRHEYQASVTALARYLQSHPDIQEARVSAPYVDYWNPWSKMNFDLYYRGHARVRWFNGARAALFDDAPLFVPLCSPPLDDELKPLLVADSRLERHDNFTIYWPRSSQLLEERLNTLTTTAWTSPEGTYVSGRSEEQRHALPLPANFGRQLAFLGYSYDRDAVERGTEWRLTTWWQVLAPRPAPLAIFVHLLGDDNAVIAGWDGLQTSPEGWQRGDVFAQVHALRVPTDAPPGLLRVELGAYSPVTLERLVLYTNAGEQSAPYNRALLKPLRVR